MMRDVCSPMPMWFPPCRTSRLFAVVGSMQKEDAHCGDRKDHPLDKSQQQLSSPQKLFSPHTPEHIPGQQQSQTAPSHHACGILQEEGCRSGSSQHLGNSACLIGTRAIKPTHRSRAKLSSDGKRGCASPSCSSSKNEIR